MEVIGLLRDGRLLAQADGDVIPRIVLRMLHILVELYQRLNKGRILRVFNGMATGAERHKNRKYNYQSSHTPRLFQSLISPSTAFLPVK